MVSGHGDGTLRWCWTAELSIRCESSDKLRFVLPIATVGPTFPLAGPGVPHAFPLFGPSSFRFQKDLEFFRFLEIGWKSLLKIRNN